MRGRETRRRHHPSRAEAAAYVEAEREAVAALPGLLPGTSTDARTALGSIDGDPIRLDLRTVPHPTEPDFVRFQLVARGPEKTTAVLRTLDEAAHELVVASRARVRAQLLSRLGLRRYRSGDRYAASELFRQATRERTKTTRGVGTTVQRYNGTTARPCTACTTMRTSSAEL